MAADVTELIVEASAVLAALAVVGRLLVYPLVKWGRQLAEKVELIEQGVVAVHTVDRRLSDIASVRDAIESGVKAMQKIQGSQEDRVTILEGENVYRVTWERTHDARHDSLDVRLAAIEASIRDLAAAAEGGVTG